MKRIWVDGELITAQKLNDTDGSVSFDTLDEQLKDNFIYKKDATLIESGQGGINISGGKFTGYGTQNYWSHAVYSAGSGDNLWLSFGKSNNQAVTAHIFATDDDNNILNSWFQGGGDQETISDYKITSPTNTTKILIQSFLNVKISAYIGEYQSVKNQVNANNNNIKQELSVYLDDKIKIANELNNSSVYNFISRQGQINGMPENSNIAIINAKNNGLNSARVSLAFTSDNVPVLLHDKTINKMARNLDGTQIANSINISDITLEQANGYDWGIAYGSAYKGLKIPLLTDFLKICSFKSILPTLEFKPITITDAQIKIILDLLNKYGLVQKTFFTTNVDAILLSMVKANPSINIGFIAQLNANIKVDYALQFKTEYNKVRLDIFDTDNPTTDMINYASSKGVSIKVGSAYSIDDIVKWTSLGVTDIEVANLAFPATALNKYYDSL